MYSGKAPKQSDFVFGTNNFDLIRLLAALQVTLIHGLEHLGIGMPFLLNQIIQSIPGVPIFFVISGYLISASFERRKSLANYYFNRFLRVYPGLWFCLLISILSVVCVYPVSTSLFEGLAWLSAQLTVGQFYNPDFLRGYGLGVLNGSLWTIPVELQFYVCLPIIYWIITRLNVGNTFLLICVAALALVNLWYYAMFKHHDTLASKLFGVTLLPHLYLFLLGMVLQKNQPFIRRYLAGRCLWWLALLAGINLLCAHFQISFTGNNINPLSATIVALLTVSAAYSNPSRYSNILKGNDISYGIYIYHGIVLNSLIFFGQTGALVHVGLLLIMTLLLALFSWHFIERPALALKHYSIKRGAVTHP